MLPDFIYNFFGFISKYKIFGFIPLNGSLHLIISSMICIFLLKKKVDLKKIFLIIITLGTIKEIFDSYALNDVFIKHFYDMAINLAFPTMVLIYKTIIGKISKIKNQSKDGTSPIKSNFMK